MKNKIITALIRLFIGICIIIGCIVLGLFTFLVDYHCVDFSRLYKYHAGAPSIIVDDEGNEIGRFQLDYREPISLYSMSPHLINAFIAAEDWHFFEHSGISWKGVLRSLVINCLQGRRAQGASTITQQLMRLLFFDTKKTFTRKIK